MSQSLAGSSGRDVCAETVSVGGDEEVVALSSAARSRLEVDGGSDGGDGSSIHEQLLRGGHSEFTLLHSVQALPAPNCTAKRQAHLFVIVREYARKHPVTVLAHTASDCDPRTPNSLSYHHVPLIGPHKDTETAGYMATGWGRGKRTLLHTLSIAELYNER